MSGHLPTKDAGDLLMGRSSLYTVCYATILPDLRRVAMEKGYALTVHGSMRRDLDLVACPWTEEACDAAELIEAIRLAIGGVIGAETFEAQPRVKPHGRLAWSMYFDEKAARYLQGPYLDISVMPRTITPEALSPRANGGGEG